MVGARVVLPCVQYPPFIGRGQSPAYLGLPFPLCTDLTSNAHGPLIFAAKQTAGSGVIWDLRSNRLRPDTWTNADAAGLPILPGLVRYDEVARGVSYARA